MSTETLKNALALLLLVSFIVPTTFLMMPQKTSAQALTGCLGGLAGLLTVPAALVAVPTHDTAVGIATGDAAGSTWASCINQFVIEPLIRAEIRALIQKLTASVVTWINGGNGTGQPSYVQNLPGHLQSVGDIQALSFFAQFGANSNSPFAAAITSSLSTNYLQNTSSAGFFGANKDTLVVVTGSAANENAFLSGNWAQGGTAAWFALTTQSQNNPYMLYQNSQSQLGSLVGGAQSNRLNELSWGSGFLSWCGPTGPGTAAGDSCKNADGTHGKTQTPGSVIHDYTQQAVVNSGFQQLISANDIDSALSAIISALLNQVLGGVNGLFGASQNGGNNGNAALTAQLQTYAAGNNNNGAAAAAAAPALQAASAQTTSYSTSWQTVSNAANAASAAVSTLVASCTAAAATATNATFSGAVSAQATAASTALTTEITPILAQANAAVSTASTAQGMIQKIQNEINSGIDTTADLQALQAMPPSATDASTAAQNASVTGGATATPAGSLTVTGGTTVDQMNLLAANATTLKTTVCTGP